MIHLPMFTDQGIVLLILLLFLFLFFPLFSIFHNRRYYPSGSDEEIWGISFILGHGHIVHISLTRHGLTWAVRQTPEWGWARAFSLCHILPSFLSSFFFWINVIFHHCSDLGALTSQGKNLPNYQVMPKQCGCFDSIFVSIMFFLPLHLHMATSQTSSETEFLKKRKHRCYVFYQYNTKNIYIHCLSRIQFQRLNLFKIPFVLNVPASLRLSSLSLLSGLVP